MNTNNIMKTTAKLLKHDWTRFYALSEALGDGAAMRDPDAVPLTPAEFHRLKRCDGAPLRSMNCRRRRLAHPKGSHAEGHQHLDAELKDWRP
jgi:hypothetical protein